jgi:hypothetical protein
MAYVDMNEAVGDFFRASIERRLDDYDFESVFEYASMIINQKLAGHGLTSYEEFYDDYNDMFGNDVDLSQYETHTDWIVISHEDIHEAILRYMYDVYKRTFSGMGAFQDLQSLYNRMQNIYGMSTKERAILFDEVIHAQHVTGDIFEDLDIEAIKEEIDAEYAPGSIYQE